MELALLEAEHDLNISSLTLSRCPDYMHHANPETPIEETMRALAELKA